MAPREQTPTSWPLVVVLWLCGVFAAMQFSKVSFAFTSLQALYAITPAQTGLLLSTVGVVGLLLGVSVGLIAPNVGYRRLLLGGLGLGAAIAAVQVLTTSFGLFWATRLLEGLSQLAVVVAAPTLIAANCAPQHRAIGMGLWSTFVGVAFALTGLAGGWVMDHFGVSGILLCHALGMATMFVAAWVMVPGELAVSDKPTKPAVGQWPHLEELPRFHRAVYTHRDTALPGACFFFYTFMAVSLITFVPPLGGVDKPWMLVVLPLVTIFGSFSSGWLANWVGTPTLGLRIAFTGVALSALAMWGGKSSGLGIGPAAIALLYLAGLAGGSAYALIPFLNRSASSQARANGAIVQLGNLGSTLGPPIFAQLISIWGIKGLALPVVLLALSGLGVALVGSRQIPR